MIIIINVVAKRNCLLPELYARKIMNKVKKVISLILESSESEYLLDTPIYEYEMKMIMILIIMVT